MLTLRNVTVAHGNLVVVRDVSLELKEKGFVSVIGSNGAGKSSLLDAIFGINRISSGQIMFYDSEISSWTPSAIVTQGIILVSEGRKLFRNITVLDNLLVGGSNARAKAEVSANLEWVFSLFPVLKARQGQVANTLSGGELQMLAIGCGLMGNPKLLMLDEPSIGLAPVLVKQIFERIITLNQEEVSILLVEQNVTKSLEASDYTYVLENGQIVLEGKSSSLKDDPHIKEAYLGI